MQPLAVCVFSKASEEQIPTVIREEATKRVNCHKNGNLPLFCIEKDTRVGVLYAPFACVPVAEGKGFEPLRDCSQTVFKTASL